MKFSIKTIAKPLLFCSSFFFAVSSAFAGVTYPPNCTEHEVCWGEDACGVVIVCVGGDGE